MKPFIFGASWISPLGTRIIASSSQCSECSTKMGDKSQPASWPAYVSGCTSVAFVTTPDDVSAKKIAHSLVSNKLAACVNIIPRVTSIYEWEGKINEDSEFLMMIKTRTSRVDELVKFVRENHPYSVAEVITLPIENGNAPYLNWITNTVPEIFQK